LAQIKAEDEHTLERTRKVREACAQASNEELRPFNRFRHEKSELDIPAPKGSRKNYFTFLNADASRLAALFLLKVVQRLHLRRHALSGGRLGAHKVRTYFCANPNDERVSRPTVFLAFLFLL